jgi:DNA processing protein
MNRGLLDLALIRLSGLSARERLRLSETLASAAELAALPRLGVERLIGRPLRVRDWDPAAALARAEADGRAAGRSGIAVVGYADAAYPPLLRELSDPPLVLFCRGSLPDPERPLAAVVGTRTPTAAGGEQAYAFGYGFGRRGVAVVSGLALGIDARAHRGNVDAGAPSVAVLGSGLENVYPASNRSLARRVLEAGGALLSEYPPDEPPFKHHFPARNRIIAALGRATVVVEAPVGSGALITADFALEQGRDVWVGTAGLEGGRGEGGRALARSGAPAADSADAVLEDWRWPGSAVAAGAPKSARRPYGASLARELELELG